eukprot:1187879-Prorocentrum_minimum.AAC.2
MYMLQDKTEHNTIHDGGSCTTRLQLSRGGHPRCWHRRTRSPPGWRPALSPLRRWRRPSPTGASRSHPPTPVSSLRTSTSTGFPPPRRA